MIRGIRILVALMLIGCCRGTIAQQYQATNVSPTGATNVVASGVDDNGAVVGGGNAPDSTYKGYSRTAANGFTTIGTLGGNYSSAAAIANGIIAGTAETGNGQVHAFALINGAATDLGTLGGDNSRALAVNANGQVVGAADAADGSSRAFLWDQAGGMRDLNSLIPAGSNFVILEALSINNGSSIVASGTFNGQNCAILLTLNPPIGQAVRSASVNKRPIKGTKGTPVFVGSAPRTFFDRPGKLMVRGADPTKTGRTTSFQPLNPILREIRSFS